MDKRVQVFVSSTYLDLQDERQRVNQTLLELECFPAGMELFPASDADKWDLIKGVIDDSDYYLLILGGRYGSTDDSTALSYTEMEYKYANAQKKPVMAFLHRDLEELKGAKLEKDPAKAAKLEEFRKTVAAKRNVRHYKSPDELAAAVATSLVAMQKNSPAVGWVRGDNAMTPEIRTEIAELRAALAEAEAKSTSHAAPLFDDLADGDDTFEFDGVLTFRHRDGKTYEGEFTWEMPWERVFSELGPQLLHETAQAALALYLDKALREFVSDETDPLTEPVDFDRSEVEEFVHISVESKKVLDDVLVQFLALRLIERGTQRRALSDSSRYWKLTDRGEDRLMAMRAVRRQGAS